MTSIALCPRCHTMLAVADAGSLERQCEACHGTFRPFERAAAADIDEPPPVKVETPDLATASTEPSVLPVPCPACLTHMRSVAESVGVFECPSCSSRWEDGDASRMQQMAAATAGTDTTHPEANPTLSPLTRRLLYGVSLPERLLRSGVSLTAGAAREMAELIVPQAFQSSKSYEIAIENSLRFLTETIGGVTGPKPAEAEAGEHIARKAVGNFVDMAGLATLHVSPMWVLAAVSDIAYGTRTYVLEVARELEKQGIIDSTSTIHNMEDILTAIQRTSGSMASSIDRPPFSVEELRATLDQTRQDLSRADLTKLLPEAEVRRLWTEMRTVATQENVDLLSVSSAITMQTLDHVRTITDGTLTSIRVAGGLFNRNVVDHYRDSLAHIREKGFYETVRESYEPYIAAVWTNFSAERKTWTETLLDPNNITQAVGKLFQFLDGGDSREQTSTSS